MTSPSIRRPSLLTVLSSALEAAAARGLAITPGTPPLAIRAGRYVAGFERRVDVLGALLVGTPTRAQCFDYETSLADAATILGTTSEVVAWICGGFDSDEDPPTLEEGFDPKIVEAHALGATLRSRFCTPKT